MAVTAKWYTKGMAAMVGGTTQTGLAWNTADATYHPKVALVTATGGSTYTPDQDAHTFWDGTGATFPQNSEVAGYSTGYSAGGASLLGGTIDVATPTKIKLLPPAATTTWTAIDLFTIGAKYATIYFKQATDAASPLLGYVTFPSVVSPVSADFVITWNTDGIFEIIVD